ncbi:MAG: hypothetical protein H6737_12720 [Alphaproteobacteria bacterium]|nr:hypothetical protein [Alphaproteobacteria bacterium]
MYTVVEEPAPASAVVLDIRGFTNELSATVGDPEGRAGLLGLLAVMNGVVVQSAALALAPAIRAEVGSLVHVGSTGDGAIVVFLDPAGHAAQATLATLLMRAAMQRVCEEYSARTGRELSFGIGVESGTVNQVHASGPLPLGTYIGECINAAARVEVLTKEIHRTDVIFCNDLVGLLSEQLLGADYPRLMRGQEIPAGSISDGEYLSLERQLVELNRQLCLNYLHMHVLRGFGAPKALFRLSKSSASLGNPRFDRMIELLTGGEPAWLAQVRAAL